LQELDSIAERIAGEKALPSVDRHIVTRLVAGFFQLAAQGCKVFDCNRDVRLSRWPEVRIDSEVQLPVAEAEPAATATAQFGWLRDFGQAQQVTEEDAGLVFTSGRDCYLDVIED